MSKPHPRSSRRAEALAAAVALAVTLTAADAQAFCGFFVARAGAELFNSASQVVIAHDEGKTVLTMVNNYRGEPRAFALVVPVPVVLKKGMVRVTDEKAVKRVDAFTSPRLAEYHDPNPCAVRKMRSRARRMAPAAAAESAGPVKKKSAKSLGVTVEAEYTVGEYDIVILSAKESKGLETWLRQENYNIPRGASRALAPYIRSKMKFFVAKVNLEKYDQRGFTTLRPLQFAYPDDRFMLPVRLGMLNADGPQDLIAYVITKQYRTEVANYLNPKLPTGQEIPVFVKDDFQHFYRDMFERSVKKENGRAVFTEYAWNMAWCDPCAADPLSASELRRLGVWWTGDSGPSRSRRRTKGGAQQAYVTRLHARYTEETFPQDIMLKVTKDSANFQARFVIRHPWKGTQKCAAAEAYAERLVQRRRARVQNLVQLTGWDPNEIRAKLQRVPVLEGQGSVEDDSWTDEIKDLFSE